LGNDIGEHGTRLEPLEAERSRAAVCNVRTLAAVRKNTHRL
jgi:hypothetical protein